LPPNDAFTNRTLIKSSTVVTASLTQATFDLPSYLPDLDWWEVSNNYRNSWNYPDNFSVNGSLWWQVIVTNSCSVTVEFLNAAADNLLSERIDLWSHEWSANGSLATRDYFGSINSFTGKIPFATAVALGSNHFEVQLTGNAPLVVLRFTIHTAPLVIIPPQSRTVSPDESVFFGVQATGHSALQYQWLHNGVPISGETRPILSFDNVSPTNAGTYRVLVSDDLGTTTADATLAVSSSDSQPRWLKLQRTSTNEWRALLACEAGRSYRIEKSTNLIDWAPIEQLFQETSIRHGLAGIVSTSGVVFLRETNSEIQFKSANSVGFFRAVQYQPLHAQCLNHLKKIRFAKELVAHSFRPMDGNSSACPYDSFVRADIEPLIGIYQIDHQGYYTLFNYGTQPGCQFHTLFEPDW
jgi:hypothetical protein